jgi:NAD(P)H-dependent flavin oxidoreductase YrpB (nitropropane dioxygenase family)
MSHLKIGDKVAPVPIIQGGMGVGISLSGLASAVANAGGVGIIAANAIGMLEPDYYTNGLEANKRALRKEIRKARDLSDGIIGVNIMVALNDFHDLLQVSIEEKADLVILGAGLPLKGIPVQDLKEAGVKVVPIVSSARAAALIFRYWQKNYDTVPDALVVEGPKAGGHLGFKEDQIDDPDYALENIVPGVIAEVAVFEKQAGKSIPVIPAGGIYTGEDIYKYFEMGAGGVQMATRFVATEECDADIKFKETYINCKEDDIIIIKSPVGMPGRAIRNSFLEKLNSGEREKNRCPWRCLNHCDIKQAQYCISQALDSARQGKMETGYAFAGSNAFRVESIVPVKSLVQQLKTEYLKRVEKGTLDLRIEFEQAFKKLTALKDEYVKTARKSVESFKSDVEEVLGKGHAVFQKEYGNVMKKMDKLKAEYAHHFDKVHELKEQLSRFLDTSFLKLPTPVLA